MEADWKIQTGKNRLEKTKIDEEDGLSALILSVLINIFSFYFCSLFLIVTIFITINLFKRIIVIKLQRKGRVI